MVATRTANLVLSVKRNSGWLVFRAASITAQLVTRASVPRP